MNRALIVVFLFVAACSKTKDPPNTRPADPHETLAAMDDRVAVPMPPRMANHHRQQMRAHLEVVQAVLAALAEDDFDEVQRAAKPITASGTSLRQCDRMGRGAPGFAAQGRRFHETADSIVTAAGEKDRQGVVRALAETISTCTACHAAYRQEVVSFDEWRLLAESAQP